MSEERFTVLAADDEFWIRENLRTMLEWQAYGMRFLEPVADGEAALMKLRGQRVDILITDINMPYLSGLEVIREARRLSPDTVILVLSGYSDYEYVREALVEGALDYLLKPIARTKLLEMLNRAIEKILLNRKERDDTASIQQSLARAASTILDRDFSNLLHDARRRELTQDVQAQLFEYEQRFSGYRLTLFHLSAPASRAIDAYTVKSAIEAAVDLSPRLVIHNLYHAAQFLLMTEPDAQALRNTLDAALTRLEALTGAPAQAVVSEPYLSFGDLRKAYDETRAALMTLPVRPHSAAVFASEQEKRMTAPRLSAALQKQMEQAARARQREWFDRLVEQSGLYGGAQEGWTQLELLHCLNAIVWILRRSAEERCDPAQQLTIDTLTEMLPDALTGAEELRVLLMQLEDEVFSAEASDNSGTMRDVVARVKSYVDSHYVEDITLASLASRFCVDDSYLSKSFKQDAGSNLTLYIANKRVEQAKRLLKQKEQSITEVAQTVGYDDYAYFSRVFKKLVGVSPRAYRDEEADTHAI